MRLRGTLLKIFSLPNSLICCRKYTSKYLRNVVVTGIGVVSPLGCGTNLVWERLLAGQTGVAKVQGEGYEKIPCQVAAYVPCGTGEGEFDVTKYWSRSHSNMTSFAIAACEEALKDAEWMPEIEEEKCRTGVSIGVACNELDYITDAGEGLKTKGYRSVTPHFIPRILLNLISGEIAIKFKLKGPNHCVTTACTTGAHAIGDAMRFIAHGDCDVMVAGGSEAPINPLSFAGFCRIRALSTKYNETPESASRPFDVGRDGFVMGEGAAIMVLEEENHALKRGAKIYARIAGYGLSGDAENVVSPSAGGVGAIRCMRSAVLDANMKVTDIGYINAHGTSTPQGDLAEISGISTLFGNHSQNLAVSSSKGAVGHLLGAAGAIESVFTVLACHTGMIPQTANLYDQDPRINLNCVPLRPQRWNNKNGFPRVALSNSFGFGGTNASLCFVSV